VSFRDITARLTAQRNLRERVKELRCLYRVLELTLSAELDIPQVCAEVARILPESLLHDSIAMARVHINGEEYRSHGWQPPARSLRAEIAAGSTAAGFVEIGYSAETVADAVNPAGGPALFLDEERAMLNAIASHVGRMIHDRHLGERLTRTERLTAVGELTGGIAHDFNNLLTVIMGNAELLAARHAAGTEEDDLVRMIRQAAEAGAALTHRLLAFARRQPLLPRTVDVADMIRSMIALLQRTLGDAIEIELVSVAGLWPVTIDPVQLESAVLNLAINARDAMTEGGRLTIELSNAQIDEPYADWTEDVTPGPYVLVAVSDNGKGMSPDLVRRAFEPFFTTKEPGRGSGLGLSMVYGFVRQSRGHVRIYSEPGQGTTVKLFLPRAEPQPDSPQPPAEEPGRPDHRASAERILLVEDDALVRDHATRLLENMGHHVTTAPNAPAALALVRGGLEFDLLFTDLVMPGGMNGHDLAGAVRAIRPGVAVLFTSGYADVAVIRASQIAPDMVFLSKPYRRKDLARKVREAIEVAATAMPLAPPANGG
jgi:signal transduction histidine kinase/CheY-like chemotaxis protein